MQALQLLAAQAIVGTERQAPTPPQLPGAIGETLAALDQTDPAASLLRAAGVLSVCALAGYRPASSAMPAATPCPPDHWPHGEDASLASLCEAIIADGPLRLQAEALRLLAGGCLPYRILPKALDLGQRTRALRPLLLPVLGQRGQWLARQNPEWAYAVGQAEDDNPNGVWETGSLDQRLIYLRRLRQTDPAQARELLAQTLAESSAKERNELLATLETGLGADDEDLLETLLLKDRGKEVRQTAAGLLARLPASRYVARMAARVDACLRTQRKLLRTALVLDAPEVFGADWKADCLEEAKPQHERFGQRAWWLYQLTRALPLSWWVERTGFTPKELLDWAKQGEWQDALWRGWLEAQRQTADPAWAEAFLSHLPNPRFPADLFGMALALPPAQRERHWLHCLKKTPPQAGFGGLLRPFLLSLPADAGCFSADFSRLVLAEIATYLRGGNLARDYYLRETLTEFACLIPPEVFAEAQALWASLPAELPSYGVAGNRFPAILGQRQSLHSHPLLTRAKP